MPRLDLHFAVNFFKIHSLKGKQNVPLMHISFNFSSNDPRANKSASGSVKDLVPEMDSKQKASIYSQLWQTGGNTPFCTLFVCLLFHVYNFVFVVSSFGCRKISLN